jgi:hypothetical protein
MAKLVYELSQTLDGYVDRGKANIDEAVGNGCSCAATYALAEVRFLRR